MTTSRRFFNWIVFAATLTLAASWPNHGRADAPPGRYTIMNGTVFDTKTLLTWQRAFNDTNYTWSDAQTYCTGLDLNGTGWRLPSVNELQTIVDETGTYPAIDLTAFPTEPIEFFWTSTPFVVPFNPPKVWTVFFAYGDTYQLDQLTAGTFMILKTPLRSAAGLIKKVASGLKQGGVLIITDVTLFPKKIAEKLIEKHGQSMAPSLHQAQTILPFSRASMFTKGWGRDYQAHKILEKDMWEDVFDRTDFENLPAIILKHEEHKEITNALNQARMKLLGDPHGTPSKEQLWAIYKKIYAREPNWLKAIEHYFQP